MTTPRFRFAPSPTGPPHIGSLHTALFSWALARAMDGDFILRIDDTDPERNTAQTVQQMLDALTWLGLDWDEGPDIGGDAGPYFQSQRRPFHEQMIARLLAGDHVYYGDDPDNPATPEGQPLRLRLPTGGQTIVNDALRGPIVFQNKNLKDPVLVRSDGSPLYHLASMADDHMMGITHVVRGDEWLATAPIHTHLYRLLAWPEPVWIHLPLIRNKKGEKLKKRDPEGGYLVHNFQAAGYLPEALFNYLLLLGWAPDGTQEIVSRWDVRRQFRLERLSTSPSVFDWDKLNWVNSHYLQRYSDEQLAELIRPFLEEAYGDLPASTEWLVRLTRVIRSQIVRLADAVNAAEWALSENVAYRAQAETALAGEPAHPVLVQLIAELAQLVVLDEPTAQGILVALRARFKERSGWGAQQLFQPIRAALTGDVDGPPLHEIMAVLGKERCLSRLAAALKR